MADHDEPGCRRSGPHGGGIAAHASPGSAHARRRFFARSFAAWGAVAAAPAASPAAQYEFKSASGLPVEHPQNVRSKQMWAAIERESGGRIRVSHLANSAYGSDQAVFAQLRVGAIQFFLVSTSTAQAVVPAADIAETGFAFKNETEGTRAMDGPLGEYIRREIAAKGLYAMRRIWNSGMRQMSSSTHPIRNADDVTGFRIRVAEGKIVVDLIRTLGGSPTPMPFNELYTSLQTHIVDGAELPLVTISTGKFFEVQKYLSLTNDSWSAHWLMVNGETWKGLPADLQAVIERNSAKYCELARRDTYVMNSSIADRLVRQGMILNRTDPASFRARLAPYYATWKNNFGATEWGLLEDAVGRKLA